MRWHYLAKVVARSISELVREVSSGSERDSLEAFTAGAGGGDGVAVKQSLRVYLEALALPEMDTTLVLLMTFQLVRLQHKYLSSASWRSILFKTVVESVKTVIKNPESAQLAVDRLHNTVTHWWPQSRMEAVDEAFTNSCSQSLRKLRHPIDLKQLLKDAKEMQRDARREGRDCLDSEFGTSSLFVEMDPVEGRSNLRDVEDARLNLGDIEDPDSSDTDVFSL